MNQLSRLIALNKTYDSCAWVITRLSLNRIRMKSKSAVDDNLKNIPERKSWTS